jgi:OmcA/MtrC family decaheme c-type cytochrome
MRANRSWAAVLPLIALLACGESRSVSQPTSTPQAPGYRIEITGASVDGTTGGVTARYTLTQKGRALDAQAAAALRPSWTLAGLGRNPVSGLASWQSFLPNAGQTVPSLPIEGPGTPESAVLTGVKQPGSETGGTVQDLGGGELAYTFTAKLPADLDRGRTVRVGVYLAGTPGTPDTSATFDFVPSGGQVEPRELVLDRSCEQCHGVIQAHGGFRTGTKLCVTCHTVQLADPDTVDPAALASATAATNPNPLDLGRMVHRIHRGKELHTLRDAETGDLIVGRKYSVVGFRSSETVFGRVVSRTDNQQPALAVAEGVGYPQDLRSCQTCHSGAQADQRLTAISRRTCAGCHEDVWFQDTAIPSDDRVHRPHAGGPQADDSRCATCHLATPEHPDVPADVAAIHVAPGQGESFSPLTAEIVEVRDLRPGQKPTVVFTVRDRVGVPTPLGAPTPATDPRSPVPRALGSVSITLSGPTVPDLLTGNAPLTGSVPLTTAADAEGRFSFTFAQPLPDSAAGTWAVGLEARRRANTTAPDAWPFTGEAITEWATNPVVYVDTGAGTLPDGSPVPRRDVVDLAKCNACHGVLRAHGDLRNNPQYCVMCHTPDATDWAQRPKGENGNTALGSTYDGIEERSIDFKTMIHRIHTGTSTGAAALDASDPLVIYGFRGSVNFLGDVEFPRDIAQCTICHAGGTYRVESVQADAAPMVANETASIFHQAAPAHGNAEPRRLPITTACTGCHDTGAALAHAERNTIQGKENCAVCHGQIGFMSVDEVHGIPAE